MIFPITTAMCDIAKQVEADTLANLKKTPNYTGLNEDRRFFIGAIGECVVKQWFELFNIKFEHRFDTSGNSMGADFEVARPASGGPAWKVEVKTAGKASHRRCMLPASQSLDFQAVVGVRLDLGFSTRGRPGMGWRSAGEVLAHWILWRQRRSDALAVL